MSEDIDRAMIESTVHGWPTRDLLLSRSRGWGMASFEYARSLVRQMTTEQARAQTLETLAELQAIRRREIEDERMRGEMNALRDELVKTQQKIEAGAHIRDEASRAAEAETAAKKRHEENVRLTRRAIRWAIWATLVGVLSVLIALLSR